MPNIQYIYIYIYIYVYQISYVIKHHFNIKIMNSVILKHMQLMCIKTKSSQSTYKQ